MGRLTLVCQSEENGAAAGVGASGEPFSLQELTRTPPGHPKLLVSQGTRVWGGLMGYGALG